MPDPPCGPAPPRIDLGRIEDGRVVFSNPVQSAANAWLGDRLGIMGLHERPPSALRLLGGAMAIGGIVLVAKG